MGLSLLRMIPTFIVYEWIQTETMGEQSGRKPWHPKGAGKIPKGRIFDEKNYTRMVPGY